MQTRPARSTVPLAHDQGPFDIRLPQADTDMDQNQAWCEVRLDGSWRRFRFHDYEAIYEVPGLYEALFYRRLRCCSPRRVVSMLQRILNEQPDELSDPKLRVLDVGAGNGMVGEELVDAGAQQVFGLDIIPEARDAALRDRAWVYDDYLVADLCEMDEQQERHLRSQRFNAMTCVAALGFGDIPSQAFCGAVDLVESPAWLAFNLKEDFLRPGEATGFARLIHELSSAGVIRVEAYERYLHRLNYAGEPLYYVGMVARKLRDLPDDLREAHA